MIRNAGLAGIAAGIALIGEFTFFMLSGFTPQTFADAGSALVFLRDRGSFLRIAVLIGGFGAALTTIFLVGLAARLRERTPTRAAATLYLGVVGGGGHALVAMTFWLGIPMVIGAADRDPAAAVAAMQGLTLVTSGAEGFGNLFLALSMAAAGWAIVSSRALPAWSGWVGLAAAAFTLARIVGAETPLAFAAFFPSLIAAVVFRIWTGAALRASADVEPTRPATQPNSPLTPEEIS